MLQGVGVLAATALTGASIRAATARPAAEALTIFPLLPGYQPAEDDDDVTPPLPGDDGPRNPFDFPRLRRDLSPAEFAAARHMLLQSAFCRRSTASVEGPYYVANPLVRQNIIEDRQGLRTTMFFQVIRESGCTPIPGAIVDVWHADAAGVYSGFAQQGTAGRVYLRGVQTADANGICRFDTVFPGWYTGRTTHIHVKVRPTATTVVTLQTYFDQLLGFSGSLSNAIYRFLPPYSSRGPANTTNQTDGIFTPDTVMAAMLNPDGSPTLWTGMRLSVV